MLAMRTTLTKDDDLAWELREKAHKTGTSFKEAVNKAIRAALKHTEHGARLFSTDNDFSRFRTLRWTNPIE